VGRKMKVGDIVLSTAGRDEGSVYLVVDRAEDRRVSIVDGIDRTLRRPKRKSVRHLRRIGRVRERKLLTRLQVGRARDREVRCALAEYTGEEGCSPEDSSRNRLLEDILPAQEEAGWKHE